MLLKQMALKQMIQKQMYMKQTVLQQMDLKQIFSGLRTRKEWMAGDQAELPEPRNDTRRIINTKWIPPPGGDNLHKRQ